MGRHAATCNEENPNTTCDFEEDEISTDYLKPNTMMVEGLRRGRMSSLISVRLHFVDEIVKSAEEVSPDGSSACTVIRWPDLASRSD